jgi:hypothetical protein
MLKQAFLLVAAFGRRRRRRRPRFDCGNMKLSWEAHHRNDTGFKLNPNNC